MLYHIEMQKGDFIRESFKLSLYKVNLLYEPGADKSLALPGRKRLTEHLQPRRNWPTWASNVLRSPTLFSRSDPVGLPPVPWTEKRTEREVGRDKGLSAPLWMHF
jgi:hypothetical protein